VRSVRVVGLRTFAPMILKYQFKKIRSRHLYSRSRKKISFHIHTFDASSRQLVGFLYSLSQMFFVKFSSPFNFHPSILSSTIYIHSLVHHHNFSQAVRKFSYVSHQTLSFCYFICCDYLPSAFIFSREKATKLQMCWPFIHMFVFLLRVLVCLREE